ncbi:MAG: PKD domain-containing protein, partial [Candidatus Helarchaeota archaeon]
MTGIRPSSKKSSSKKKGLMIISVIFIIIMINTDAISALSSNIIPEIGYIESNVEIADVYEPVNFTVHLKPNSGLVEYFILNAHDGSQPEISTSNYITHAFLYEGEYLVSITAVAPTGLMDTKTILIKIENDAPIAEIQIPNYGYEWENISIKAVNIMDSDIDMQKLQYQWTIDTGKGQTTLNGSEVWYIWNNSGTFPITLIIYDDQYALFTDTKFIEIKNGIPQAEFLIEPEEDDGILLEDELLTLNASLSWDTPNDRDKLKYYWHYGDGTYDYGMVCSHSYPNSGNYTITLWAVDNDGAVSEISKNITVINKVPEVSIDEDIVYLEEGMSYTFNAKSNDTNTDFQRLNYSWSFGAEGWNATYTALDDINETIWVNVTDPEGAKSSDNVNIIISNVEPTLSIFGAYVETNLILRVWGSINNSFTLKIIQLEEDQNITIGGTTVEVKDYCEIAESDPVPIIFDLANDYIIEINYTEGTGPHGINFAELIFNFTDGTEYRMCHVFIADGRPCCRILSWLVDMDSWIIDLSDHYFNTPITFNGTIYDPGFDNFKLNGTLRTRLLYSLSSRFWWLFRWLFYCGNYETYYEIDNRTLLILKAWYNNTNHLFYFSIDLYQYLLINEQITKSDFYECNTPFTIMTRPIDLSFVEVFNCPLFNNPWFNLTVLEAVNMLEVNVVDDDGGMDNLIINITSSEGKLHIVDMSPVVKLPAIKTMEDSLTSFYAITRDDYADKSSNLTINWRFGDGYTSNQSYFERNFTNSGVYLVEISVSDGIYTTKCGYYLEVFDYIPLVEFHAPENITEDQEIELEVWTYDTPTDINNLKIWWEMGDNSILTGKKIKYSWPIAGNYTIKVHVSDDNGKVEIYSRKLEVLNIPPTIAGPEGFEAVEGAVIHLDIKITDSIYDELHMNYNWEFDGMYFTDKKPSLWLDNGDYNCTLKVSDPDGLTSELNISLKILNMPPVIIPVSKIYYGIINEVTLEAYAIDSFLDLDDLTYNWSVDNTKLNDGTGIYSSVNWTPEGTKFYDCVVSVQDDTVESFSKHFQLAVTFDADGDGLTDEYETMLGASPDDADTDNDWLTDW